MPSHLSSILHLTKAVSTLLLLLLAPLYIHSCILPAGDPRSQDFKSDLSGYESRLLDHFTARPTAWFGPAGVRALKGIDWVF